jgi:hypothetical protein
MDMWLCVSTPTRRLHYNIGAVVMMQLRTELPKELEYTEKCCSIGWTVQVLLLDTNEACLCGWQLTRMRGASLPTMLNFRSNFILRLICSSAYLMPLYLIGGAVIAQPV